MYAKKKINKLIKEYGAAFVSGLGLSSWQINWNVYHSNSKYLEKLKLAKNCRRNLYGITFIGDKTADIILFYDEITNRNCAVSTMFHELLHCLMYSLSSKVTIRQNSASTCEEKIVRILENLFITMLYRGKL